MALGLARQRLGLAELSVVEHLERSIQRQRVAARVVREAGGRLPREVGVANEVHPSDRDRIHAELACREVHQTLDDERGLRSSRAAIRARRRLVGEDALDRVGRRGDPVGAGDETAAENRGQAREPLDVGTEVAEPGDAQAEERAVSPDRQLRRMRLPAAVLSREHRLVPCLHPLHRPAEPAGGERGQDVLVVETELDAEAPTDLGRDDPDRVLGDAERLGEQRPRLVDTLRGLPEGKRARLPLGDRAARLERKPGNPLVHGPEPHDAVWTSERAVHVATRPGDLVGDVAGSLVPELGRARPDGGLGIDHRGQRIVLHLGELGSIPRRRAVRGDDEGDRVSDEAHTVAGERQPPGHLRVRRYQDRGFGSERAREIPGREDGVDARVLPGAGDVDADDARVGMWRADDPAVDHAGEDEVVQILRLAADEPRVLQALDFTADEARSGHRRGLLHWR